MNGASAFFCCVFLAFSSAADAPARSPAAAGRFYPADARQLAAQVDALLDKAPAEAPPGEIVAALVPHAGIDYSGATAARVFKLLKPGHWDAVVIVGTGHFKELEGAAVYPGAYATPQGALPYDQDLARRLVAATRLIRFDASAHDKEHSIEVELPFLRRRLGPVKLAALVMNTEDLETARAIGRALAKVLRGRRVLLLASSDMSHYPSGAAADVVDPTTLAALETLDPAYFWLTNRLLRNRGVDGLAVTYCGEGAVIAVMEAARELGASSVRVLGRVNSGDVVPERDYSRVVGYGAALFLKGAAPAPPAALGAAERAELLGLARKSIASYLSSGKMPFVSLSRRPSLNLPAAVFVTLETKSGALRGCVGSLEAQESLAESAAHNAVAAAASDARFKPVEASELPALRIEISRLSRAAPVPSAAEVKKGDGVILEEGGHTGVFLPQVWEQLKDKADFLGELCEQKARLPRDCWKDGKAVLKTFSAEVFREP